MRKQIHVGHQITTVHRGRSVHMIATTASGRGRFEAVRRDDLLKTFPHRFALADENVYWIRGWHDDEHGDVRAMLAASALEKTT